MSQETSRRIQLHALGESEEQISNLVNELISYCLELDIEVSRDEAEMCIKHLLMVNQVNDYMNLTRIQDIHDALILHIVDSLALTRDLPIEPERFLDIGTGAGFPGIPFCVYTGCDGVLLDSVGKKVQAVQAFIEELGLKGVEAVHDRCESYATAHHHAFDIVLARAVGQMNLIVEYATPFLEEDGYLIVAKANPSKDECHIADQTASICGLELIGSDEFELPRGLGHRTVFLYQKVSNPKIHLPRPVGLAKKQPLVS